MTDATEDFLFSRLPWTAAGSDTQSPFWVADLEISPAKTIALWVRDRSSGTLREANEHFDAIRVGLAEISDRLRDLLRDRLSNDEPERRQAAAGDGAEDSSAVGEAPALPSDAARPDAELLRIAFDTGREATLSFNVRLLGRDFIIAIPHHLDGPSAAAIHISVEGESLGPFELVDLRSERARSYSRPAYAAYFVPSGYLWEGMRMILSPLPCVRDRSRRARFRDAIEAMPTLLDRAEHSAARDPARLLDAIVDHLLDGGIGGPWRDYDLSYELRDEAETEEEDEGEDEDRSDHSEEDEEALVYAARRRMLADILPFSGPPEVLLFADGSALVSCAHRTSSKSDVFVIELEMEPEGRFLECDVKLVYEGE